MIQGNPTRLEEYATLRKEMLSLFAHGRDVLYRTIGLIILALAWYAIQAETRKMIPPSMFTVFLLAIEILSAITYSSAMDQAYRVGSYLAVFWESADPERWLMWHRFNRHGPRARFRPNVDASVYVSLTIAILFFYGVFVYQDGVRSVLEMSVTLFLALFAVFFSLFMGRSLQGRRVEYETGWRLIKGSPARQAEIHRHYETPLLRA